MLDDQNFTIYLGLPPSYARGRAFATRLPRTGHYGLKHAALSLSRKPTPAPTSPNLWRFVPQPPFEQWADPRRCGQPLHYAMLRSAARLAPRLCTHPPQRRKTSGCARKARHLFALICTCCATPRRRIKAETKLST